MHVGRKEESELLTTTPRLAVRARKPEDAIVMRALAANPAIAPNLCATIPPGGDGTFAIVERSSERIVGGAALGGGGLGTGIEVTLWIGEPDWGRGYGTEAAHALIDHVFADADVAALWCSNRATNPRARRVIEKCGFQYRGAGMMSLPGRGAIPIERFILDRGTWTSLKAWGGDRLHGAMEDGPRETAA